jgi:septum formation inhibitor MinC
LTKILLRIYFNLKSLFNKLQTHSISEALSFQVTQAENLLEQYAISLQHFNRLTTNLNEQIETLVKHFDLASQGNAEVSALKAASASAFLQISACEDNIARWKSEIRELEYKIGQEEEKKKQLEAQAVEVPKTTIEEKAKIGIHHYSEALRAGVEADRLAGEKNVVQRKLAQIKSLYDQFRQAHI